jgi:dihydrofolate synthase/folylpolyglutamate synthase
VIARTSRRERPPAGLDYLAQLGGRSPDDQRADPSPRRVAALLDALGNPQRRYRSVHITGTNGKGSVAAMTAGLFAAEGLRVGVFTSPHLSRVNERVIIAGREVSDQALDATMQRVGRAAAQLQITPSWFEAITVAALWLFAAHDVDAAIVEVGMLGQFDATNVLGAPIAVITNVELDHTAEAGGGRGAIAAAKAHIVAPGATLIVGESDERLRPIFEERAPARILTRGRELSWENRRPSLRGSRLDLVNPWGRRRDVAVGMLGAHQCDNAILALSAAEAFLNRAVSQEVASRALARTRVAGRFEIRHHAPLVVLDGAHNAAAAVALRRAVSEVSAGMTPRTLVYGVREGRDPATFLRQCGIQHVDRIFITEIHRGFKARNHATVAASEYQAEVAVIPEPGAALRQAVSSAGRHGLVVATGSLHLVGQLRTEAPGRPPARHAPSSAPRLVRRSARAAARAG